MLGILVDGSPADRATQGQIAEVILAETALYAESGGQVADKGVIVGPGFELEVLDVQKPVAGLVSHTVEVTSGEVGVGQPATSVVDAANRRAARQAHSATHLVHAALRDTLGRTATQAGSLNRAGYMRFDFTWGQALSDATKSEIEEIANNAVRDNLEVTTRVLALDEAKSLGAHGAVRREVRRHRAHGRHRRPVVARALRGHARRRRAPRSASSTSSASRRSARPTAASRRSSGSTRSARSRPSARSSRS